MVLIARKWLGIKASLENGNKIKITIHSDGARNFK
jgi:hypothetical protein